MKKERGSRAGRAGARNRNSRKRQIRGNLTVAALAILVVIYLAVVGIRMFSERASDPERNIIQEEVQETKENQNGITNEPTEENSIGITEIRNQLAEIRSMELGVYTEETVKNLLDYIAAAETLIAGDASQEKLQDISGKLSEAVDGLILADGAM